LRIEIGRLADHASGGELLIGGTGTALILPLILPELQSVFSASQATRVARSVPAEGARGRYKG